MAVFAAHRRPPAIPGFGSLRRPFGEGSCVSLPPDAAARVSVNDTVFMSEGCISDEPRD